MNWIETIGYVAAISTTISFIPQAMKTIQTKDTSGISLGMYVVFTFGVLMWLLYGCLSINYPIIADNVITLFLAVTILIYKLKYK